MGVCYSCSGRFISREVCIFVEFVCEGYLIMGESHHLIRRDTTLLRGRGSLSHYGEGVISLGRRHYVIGIWGHYLLISIIIISILQIHFLAKQCAGSMYV